MPVASGINALPQTFFLHGDIGILDEFALVACVLIAFALLVTFYVFALRQSKQEK